MKNVVLIIENDDDILDLLSEIVFHLDLEVEARRDIIPLFELETLNPSLILLDHWLDDSTGADYCMELKTNPSTSHIPVVMVSAMNALSELSSNANADAYIAKPFDLDHLEHVVQRFIPSVK